MSTIFLIASIFTALMLTCDIYILVHPHLSIKKYPIFFLLFSSLFLLQLYFNFSPILLISLTLNSALLVKFTKKLYSFFYIPVSYISSCIIIHIFVFIFSLLFKLSTQEFNTNIFLLILLDSCTMIAGFPFLYLIRLIFEKYFLPLFQKVNKKIFILISFTILICGFLIYIFSSFFDTLEISYKDLFLLVALLVLYSIFTISMIFIVLHISRKNYEARKKVEYMESLNEYTKNLETVYNNLRSFKHDYLNIMTSLAAYIDEKKYRELETFFYEHILPMKNDLAHQNSALNNLLHIHTLELKSIIYTKLILAINQNIEVNVDIPDEIDSINMDPIDLTRVMGIYLDNAIEASLETKNPVINFHLGKMNGDTIIIISNTFIDKGLSISQMYKKEVTTKENGHGIGLYNVSEILKQYNHIFHQTSLENGLFIQQLLIS